MNIDVGFGLYYEVDQNLTQQDHKLCDYLNREGRLCGACKENHFISPMTWSAISVTEDCLLIIIYITVAYVPLTAWLLWYFMYQSHPHNWMLLYLCAKHIPYLLTYELLHKQVMRNNMSIFLHNYIIVLQLPLEFGTWTFSECSFLRFACHWPQCRWLLWTTWLLPILLLLVCFYVLVTAHDRGCRLVVRMWRPFLWCSRQQWNIRHSIIDALRRLSYYHTSSL